MLAKCLILFLKVATLIASPQVGIKTRIPIKTGNIFPNLSAQYSETNNDDKSFGRAENNHPNFEGFALDQHWKFVNETRSKMSSGICFEEVLTSSIAHNDGFLPAGNGSNPNMSKIQVCCNGYERNIHSFYHCDPICLNGCPNGICVGPEECVCYPGFFKNLANFCSPTCPIGCGNGECDGDICRCNPGYALHENGKFCVPICSNGCKHGNCTDPEVCSCDIGYNLQSGSCEPICDHCENGSCLFPGVCQCNLGYIRTDNKCEPQCTDGCKGGICVAPNTCSCPSGFSLDSTGLNCIPSCDIPCINGICTGSNKCTCNSGYIPDDIVDNVCKPNCPQGCQNGFCTSPGFCVCKYGYIKTGVKGKQLCTPI